MRVTLIHRKPAACSQQLNREVRPGSQTWGPATPSTTHSHTHSHTHTHSYSQLAASAGDGTWRVCFCLVANVSFWFRINQRRLSGFYKSSPLRDPPHHFPDHLSLFCCDFRTANFFNEWRSLKLIVVCGASCRRSRWLGARTTHSRTAGSQVQGCGPYSAWYLLNRQLTSNFDKWNVARLSQFISRFDSAFPLILAERRWRHSRSHFRI